MKILFIALLIASSIHSTSKAQTPATDSTASMNESLDQRSQMADLHQTMAICLRSSKPMTDCHEEMKASCKMNMGEDSCMMSGHMMDKKGMMKGQRAMEMKKTEKIETRE